MRWALTAVFAIAAVLFVIAGRRAEGHGVWALHGLASVAMIAMVWPVGMQIPPVLYVLVFTACALYFAYLAMYHGGLPHPVYHVTMMGAMAAMGLLMTPNAATPAASAHVAASGHHHVAQAAGATAQTPGWFTVACVVLAAGFGVATLWWFYLLVKGPQRPFADVLMALGMSVSFAAMAA